MNLCLVSCISSGGGVNLNMATKQFVNPKDFALIVHIVGTDTEQT